MLPNGLVPEFVYRDHQYLIGSVEGLCQAGWSGEVALAHTDATLLEIFRLLRITDAYADLITRKTL